MEQALSEGSALKERLLDFFSPVARSGKQQDPKTPLQPRGQEVDEQGDESRLHR